LFYRHVVAGPLDEDVLSHLQALKLMRTNPSRQIEFQSSAAAAIASYIAIYLKLNP